jgi:hypothetical protein
MEAGSGPQRVYGNKLPFFWKVLSARNAARPPTAVAPEVLKSENVIVPEARDE